MQTEEIDRYTRLVKQALGEKLWLNLGVVPARQLETLQEDIEGIVASLETLEPKLHKKTCPDKPIQPYINMLDKAKELGMKRSITLVIGLGEDESHWQHVEEFIKENPLERITIYALRPVRGTPYEKGPSSQELAWWIAKTRTTFPKIEIIAGTAEYRIPEIPLLLKAGANALTKLPATKLFNTQQAKDIKDYIEKTGRKWVSTLEHTNPQTVIDVEEELKRLDLTEKEREEVKKTLASYLRMMHNKLVTLN